MSLPTDCRRRRLTTRDRLVVGPAVDDETRCAHYNTDRDVIAIRFACCGTYYPCFQCHDSGADHDAEQWPRGRFDDLAVLCGVCGAELTVHQYLDCDHECPNCEARFNRGCRRHADRYVLIDAVG